jgi:4-hydroxy-tetrahydrodipicolinate synthase
MSDTVARLTGAFPVLPTPFLDDESLDLESLGTLVDRVLARGIGGLTVLGSSAEATYLSAEERTRVLDFVARRVNRRATLLVGIIQFGTAPAVDEGKRFRDLGADALLVALPQYYRTPLAQVVSHFRRIREGTGLPVLYYHYPDPTHLRLTPEEVGKLFAEVDLCGIKNSSIDTSDTLAQMRAVGRPIQMFTGSSFDCLACLKGGAVGAICPVAAIMPTSARRMVELERAGDASGAQELQNHFYKALPIVMPEPSESGPPVGVPHAGVKEALAAVGLIRSARIRDPQPLPSEAKRRQIRELAPALIEL